MDWNTMEYFDDRFDILDDDHDLADFKTDELNRYFLSATAPFIYSSIVEEEMVDQDQFNDQNDVELSEEVDQEILSQKLSQLSTQTEEEQEQNSLVTNKKRQRSIISTSDVIAKRMKMTTDDNDFGNNLQKEQDQIPAYLLTTNKSFKHLIQNMITTTNSISINDFQQIALLIHHIAVLHIQEQILMINLNSGTGTLRDSEKEFTSIDRRVWPVQVKSAMLTKQTNNLATLELNMDDEHLPYENVAYDYLPYEHLSSDKYLPREHLAYEDLIHRCSQEMDKKIEQYKKQFDTKKSQLIGFTSTMEDTITNYIYQVGIQPFKIKRDLKIALLKYDYDAEIIKRKFLQEQPNEYQIQIVKRLYKARNDLEKSKRELLELKQRIFYNKPFISYNSIQASSIEMATTITTTTNNNNNPQKQLLNKHEKIMQRKILDLMAIHILKIENRFYQCQKIFDDDLSKMWQNHRNLVQHKGMPKALTDLMEQHFTNITDRWREIYNFRIKYYFQTSYGDWEAIKQKYNNEQQMIKIIGFQPRMIIDATTTHSLTDKQIQLLNRGPTYVPPCQIHISSSCSSIDDILKKQFAPLKHKLGWIFTKYKTDLPSQFTIDREFYEPFKKFFSMPLPSDLEKRALYEKKLIQTIYQSLKKNNLILRRTADNMNTFYLGNREDFEKKANDYLIKTDNYKVFFAMNEENNQQQQLRTKIKKLIDSINYALKILRKRDDINEDLYQQLLIDTVNFELPYLYFLPNVSNENDITLIPIITSHNNLTYKISKYLDRLLRPFANEKMESVIFHDGLEFMQKLNAYTKECLTSRTIFCTIKILNYFTLDSHENIIDTVCYFIRHHIVSNKLEKISIMTIKNLLQLCLCYNIFFYKNKIYTFIKGGPTTLPLIDTLSNIYLFVWQEKIADEIQRHKELFGRYKDQIFFTWNATDDELRNDELRNFLQIATQKYPNVHIQTCIGSNVQFLNAYIANHNGELYTRVYHDPSIQGYTLPYVVGHSKLQHSDWIRSALIQAVCYCSSVNDFNQERIYIELTCLVNGYSFIFVESRIYHFYDYFHTETLRYDMNQTMYNRFRHQWFNFIDTQRTLSNKLQNFNDNEHLIRFNYLYEFGPRCQFNEEFHKIWIKHFGKDTVLCPEKTAIILTTKHLYSLNALLAQQKSFCSIQI